MRGSGERPVALVDERHDLLAEVRVVAARAGRVEELAAPELRPRVDEDDDGGLRGPRGERLVAELEEVLPEGRDVAPRAEEAGQPLDDVERRQALVRVVVAGRHVDPERAHVGVAEGVVAQGVALELVLVEAAGGLPRPGLHGG